MQKCHFLQQIPLSEHSLAGLASADLEPEGIAESAHNPHSQKVRILLVTFESCFFSLHNRVQSSVEISEQMEGKPVSCPL